MHTLLTRACTTTATSSFVSGKAALERQSARSISFPGVYCNDSPGYFSSIKNMRCNLGVTSSMCLSVNECF